MISSGKINNNKKLDRVTDRVTGVPGRSKLT